MLYIYLYEQKNQKIFSEFRRIQINGLHTDDKLNLKSHCITTHQNTFCYVFVRIIPVKTPKLAWLDMKK